MAGAQAAYPMPSQRVLFTFVVERTIEVVAASVEAGGQLNEVASPRVAGAREAGQSDELLGLGWEESSVHAAVVCKGQGAGRAQWTGQGHVKPGCESPPSTSQPFHPVHTMEPLLGLSFPICKMEGLLLISQTLSD